MRKYCRSFVTLVAVFLSPSVAVRADVLFDSGSPDYAGFSPSDFSYSGPFGFPLAAAPLTLDNDSNVREFVWWGVFWSPTTDRIVPTSDDFQVRVYPVESETPVTASVAEFQSPIVVRTDTGVDFGGNDAFRYTLDASNLFLVAGDYALEVVNNSPNDRNDDWFWLTSCDLCGRAYVRDAANAPWQRASNTLSLQVRGIAVPEPSGTTPLFCVVLTLIRFRTRHVG